MLLTLCCIQSRAQSSDTASHETAKRGHHAIPYYSEYGRFNYKYLRIALPTPSGDFANPISSIPEAAGHFAMTSRIKNAYTAGLEGGRVRHFGAVGTDMLEFGINSGWAMQAFGQGDASGTDYQAHSEGTYSLRIGLGPQFTFKPHEDFRIGLYYRFGLALLYSTYTNQQTTQSASDTRMDQIDTRLLNGVYNGDIGLDLSYRSLCLGFAYSMMTAQLSKGQLFNASTYAGNTVNTYTVFSNSQPVTTTPIDPKFNLNRFVISAGFAF